MAPSIPRDPDIAQLASEGLLEAAPLEPAPPPATPVPLASPKPEMKTPAPQKAPKAPKAPKVISALEPLPEGPLEPVPVIPALTAYEQMDQREVKPVELAPEQIDTVTQNVWRAGLASKMPEFKRSPERLRPPMSYEDAVKKSARDMGMDFDELQASLVYMQYPSQEAWDKAQQDDRPRAMEWVTAVREAGGLTPLPPMEELRKDIGTIPVKVAEMPLVYDQGIAQDRYVAKPGEAAYMYSEALLREALADPERAQWINVLETSQVVTTQEIEKFATDAMEKRGITPADGPLYTKWRKFYVDQARDAAIAWRTVGNTGGVLRLNTLELFDGYKPVQELYAQADEAWESGNYPEWARSLMGSVVSAATSNIEILGYGRDRRQLILREERPVAVALNLMGTPQAAAAATVNSILDGIAQGEVPEVLKNPPRVQLQGVADRANLTETGGNIGYQLTESPWGVAAGSLVGLVGDVILPDASVGIGDAIRGGSKVLKAFGTAAGVGRDARRVQMGNGVKKMHEAAIMGDYGKADELEHALRADPRIGNAAGSLIEQYRAAGARFVDKTSDTSVMLDAGWKPSYIGKVDDSVDGADDINEFLAGSYWQHRSMQKKTQSMGTGETSVADAGLDIAKTNNMERKQRIIDGLQKAIDDGKFQVSPRMAVRELRKDVKPKAIKAYLDGGGKHEKKFMAALDTALAETAKLVDPNAPTKAFDDAWKAVDDLMPSNMLSTAARLTAAHQKAVADANALLSSTKMTPGALKSMSAKLGRTAQRMADANKAAQAERQALLDLRMTLIPQARKIAQTVYDTAKNGGALKDFQRIDEAVQLQKEAMVRGLEMAHSAIMQDSRILVQPWASMGAGGSIDSTIADPRQYKIAAGSVSNMIEDVMARAKAAGTIDPYKEIADHVAKYGGSTFKVDGKDVAATAANARAAIESRKRIVLKQPFYGHKDLGLPEMTQALISATDRLQLQQAKRAPRIPTRAPGETVEADKLTDLLDHLVHQKVEDRTILEKVASSMVKLAHNITFGGMPYQDLSDISAAFRPVYARMARPVEAVVGEVASLLQRGDEDIAEFYRYLDGVPRLRTTTGVPLTSSGYVDTIGVTAAYFQRQLDALSTEHRRMIEGVMNATKVGEGINVDAKMLYGGPKVYNAAMDALFSGKAAKAAVKASADEASSDMLFGGHFFRDLKIGMSSTEFAGKFDHTDLRVFRAVLKAGEGLPPGQRAQAVIEEIDKAYPSSLSRAGRQAGVMMAAHAAGSRALDDTLQLGGIFTKTQRDAYVRFLSGTHLADDEIHIAQDMINSIGVAANLVTVGVGKQKTYIPQGAVDIMQKALARGLDPEKAALRGTGNPDRLASNVLNSMVAFAKRSVVFGNYWVKTRYTTMQFGDIFDGTARFAGGRAAVNVGTRTMFQNALSLPAVAPMVALMGKGKRAWEVYRGLPEGRHMRQAARESLQSLGDEFAHVLTKQKWRIEVNQVLRGGDDVIRTPTGDYAASEILRVATEEAVMATFGTQLLADSLLSSALNTNMKKLQNGDIDDLSLVSELSKSLPQRIAEKVALEIKNNHRELANVVSETVEMFDVRSRIGTMVALMQEGLDPRSAARLTVEMHFDFAGTVGDFDRNVLVRAMFPFWAFRKNSIRQYVDTISSPMGAYRMGAVRRAKHQGIQSVQQVIDAATTDPYGVDPDGMDPQQQKVYYAMREQMERYYGGPMFVPVKTKFEFRALMKGGEVGSAQLYDGQMYRISHVQTDMQKLYDWSSKQEFYDFTSIVPGDTVTPDYILDANTLKFGGDLDNPEVRRKGALDGDLAVGLVTLPDTAPEAALDALASLVVLGWGWTELVAVELGQVASNKIRAVQGKDPEYIDRGGSRWQHMAQQTVDTFDVSRSPILGSAARIGMGLMTEGSGGDYVRVNPLAGWALSQVLPMTMNIKEPTVEGEERTYFMSRDVMNILTNTPGFGDLYRAVDSMSKGQDVSGLMGSHLATVLANAGFQMGTVTPAKLGAREQRSGTSSTTAVPVE